MKIDSLTEFIEKKYPLYSEMDYDNSGANILCKDDSVKSIVVCLDITDRAIDFAIENDANLIISHHPIIFNALKSINDDSLSRKIKRLIANSINAYSAHTNFDSSIKYGMGAALISKLFDKKCIKKNSTLTEFNAQYKKFGIGNVVYLNNGYSFNDMVDMIATKLTIDKSHIASYDFCKGNISKVVIIAGSGSGDIDAVLAEKPDLLITSDLKHNHIIDLYDNNISYINATHYGLEKVFVEYMSNVIYNKFKCKVLKYYDEL